MAHYEHVFLARQDLSQAQVDTLATTATEIVEANVPNAAAVISALRDAAWLQP